MEQTAIYVISTVAAVALASFSSLNNRMREAIKPTLGIILLAALLAPLPDIIAAIGDMEVNLPSDELSQSVTEDAAEDAFCRGICSAIAEKFDLDADSLTVECIGFSFSEMRAELIRVELSGRAVLADRIGIEGYIEKAGLGNCEVVILIE
ncbi:MAG: hypothetical protein E7617_01995 [Ruminococcaceae bacterium]|nr:hypothetical protein [Oscillospiraceae bacterium]